MSLAWDVVSVDKPDDVNVVIGQAHFIKAVEDLHEAMVGVSPSLRFGLAFCEASGPRLVRHTGNDGDLVELATRTALAIAAGHSFVIFLREGFPINILNPVQAVPDGLHDLLRHSQSGRRCRRGDPAWSRHRGCCRRADPSGSGDRSRHCAAA